MKLKPAQEILIGVWEREVICNRYHAGKHNLRFAGDAEMHFQCQGCAHFHTLHDVVLTIAGHYSGRGGCVRTKN